MRTYAAYYDNKIRMESSSGGIFSLLASRFEVVYGVGMTEDCYGAEVVRVEGDLSPLRGSKYFQAKAGDAFRQARLDLDEGRQVLFSGTGCQINGLHMFLQKKYPNLFTVDVVCHGVPSPKLWKKYVICQESRYGKLKSVSFRCKDAGWQDFGMKENQLYISKDDDSFMRMFLRDYCLRPSCYECRAKRYRTSDITIADFWGIDAVAPEMNDGLGTSLVITRTDEGQKLFDGMKAELKWKQVSYGDGVRCNPSEYMSVARPKERGAFFRDMSCFSFEEMERAYAADMKASVPKEVARKARDFVMKIIGGGKGIEGDAAYGMLLTFERWD